MPLRFQSSVSLHQLSALAPSYSHFSLPTRGSNRLTGSSDSPPRGRGAESAGMGLRIDSPCCSSSEGLAFRRGRYLGFRRSRGTLVDSSTTARPIQLTRPHFGSAVLQSWGRSLLTRLGLFDAGIWLGPSPGASR
ncbi:hypothetical protein NDU88_000336 [Pleurodeles waltl]|uniref:Uncharacterized protein n=1 Tax=Pleurodeles waltl TaxID=8319 RepID=A0AAV7P3N2_PLEWA|nr:hypothetical protein NDU88_000336 [Pleurodeles waltl]